MFNLVGLLNRGLIPHLNLFQQITSDSVVVWRAWVLCEKHRWIILGPIILLLGTTGTIETHLCVPQLLTQCLATSFAFLGLTFGYEAYEADLFGVSLTPNSLFVAAGSMSVATNATATLLIAVRAWSVCISSLCAPRLIFALRTHLMACKFGNHSLRTRAHSVLLLLVESGCVYCAIQVRVHE